MEKKYQVFISSTYTDLIEERKKMQEILLMADCIPAGMEAFVATNDEQFNVIKKVIDLCDYYVLIIGGRYGSVNEKTGLSYTEMEYDYAVEKGIPVLVFCLDSSVVLPKEKTEQDSSKQDKLVRFKDKAMRNRLASMWKDMSEFSGKAAISIMKAKSEIDRPGWIRANTAGLFNNAELLSQINELRIENKALSDKLKQASEKISAYESLETSDIAFDDAPIEVVVKGFNSNKTKKTNLRELFGIVSLTMIDGSAHISRIEDAVCKFVGGGAHYNLGDASQVRKLINQYQALGLVRPLGLGFGLTKLGEKVKDEITLIRKK